MKPVYPVLCFYMFYLCSEYVLPSGIYLLKVNIKNTRTRCEIRSKVTLKTPERPQWRRPGVFIVNLNQVNTV